MGNRNLRRVLTCTPPITDIPATTKLCLTLMALLAHDDEPLYWGGVEWLELSMGYQIGPSGRRKIMRHLACLESAGYIRSTEKRKGKRVVYELHLPPMLSTGSEGLT